MAMGKLRKLLQGFYFEERVKQHSKKFVPPHLRRESGPERLKVKYAIDHFLPWRDKSEGIRHDRRQSKLK